jgi:hypothetical protein
VSDPQRITVTVTYIDGASEVVPIRPLGLIAAERRWGGEMPQIEGSMYAAWFTLKVGRPDIGEFDDWLATLESIAETPAEDPTEAVETPGH